MKHLIFFCLPMVMAAPFAASQSITGETRQVIEWEYTSAKSYSNPFAEVTLDVHVAGPGGFERTVPAFWDGDASWKVRFSAGQPGVYTFSTRCSDRSNTGLHRKKGTLTLTPYTGSNRLYQRGPLQISKDQKHLVHADGTPFLWLADSWWHGMTTRLDWPTGFKKLTTDRKEKGFNVIQFAVGFPCDIAPFDPRGQNEAGDPMDTSFTRINPAYFQHTDLRIQHLVDQEMMPNLMGSWGYYMKWSTPEKMNRYWRYLIARYGAYPLTWMLAGEVTLAYYHDLGSAWEKYKALFREQWSEVARYIQANDPYHRLLTVHPGPGTFDGKPPINDMDALDFVMLQSGHSGFSNMERATRNVKENQEIYPNKPVLHGEVCFEGMHGEGCGSKLQRFLFWSNMLMGTAGFSYGVEGIWQMNLEDAPFGVSPGGNTWGNVPWTEAMHYHGSKQLGLGRKFLDTLGWEKLIPLPDGVEQGNEEVFTAYAAALPGQRRLVYMYYFPTGWRPVVVKDLVPESNYKITFFDPLTGDLYPGGEVVSTAEGSWSVGRPPIMQDWVILMEYAHGKPEAN